VEQQEWDAARQSFERSLEYRPNHLPTLLDLARTAIEGKRWSVAEEAIERARRVAPESLQPDYLSAMVSAARGEWVTALTRFDRLIARNPDHGLAHLQRAKVMLRRGESTEAIRSFGRACELLPSSFEAHYAMARVLTELGEDASALEYTIKAYELAPAGDFRLDLVQRLLRLAEGRVDVARRLLAIARDRKEWEASLAWLHLILVEEPGWGEGHLARGQALRNLGRLTEALSALEQAVDLKPDQFWAQHDLGTLLLEFGDPLTARLHLREALRLLDAQTGLESDLARVIRERLTLLLEG
jgi:tetratricopeptide (TPR) repeat protein